MLGLGKSPDREAACSSSDSTTSKDRYAAAGPSIASETAVDLADRPSQSFGFLNLHRFWKTSTPLAGTRA
jgi:hypothetical protein